MTAPAARRALRGTATYTSSTHGLGQDDKDALTHPEWQRTKRPAEPVTPGRAAVPKPQPAAPQMPPLRDYDDVDLLPPPATPSPAGSLFAGAGGSTVDHGAGFVLGVMLWAWIVLPFLKAGPSEVRKTIKAKFTNKAPDGTWLP